MIKKFNDLLHRYKLRDLAYFAFVAGIGWGLDFLILLAYFHYTDDAFTANVLSAIFGITFLFFVSTRTVFQTERGFLWNKFFMYGFYSAVLTYILSKGVAAMVAAGLAIALAKIATVPVSFYCNFLFMRWLIKGEFGWR